MSIKILYYSAPWCQPCRMFGPIMDEVAKEYNVKKINIDEDNILTEKYGVMSIPTLVILKDGKEFKRLQGVQSKKDIVSLLQ